MCVCLDLNFFNDLCVWGREYVHLWVQALNLPEAGGTDTSYLTYVIERKLECFPRVVWVVTSHPSNPVNKDFEVMGIIKLIINKK